MMKIIAVSLLAVLGAAGGASAAEEAAKAMPDRAKMVEQHEKISEMHKKTAECLKAGKPAKECHEAMMKDASGMKGECAECAMCGEHKKMHWRPGTKDREMGEKKY